MKTNYILVGLLTLSLTACKEKFLDLSPVSAVGTTSFYKTQSDI